MTEPKEVTLHVDGDNSDLKPINGLALWTVLNQHDIERSDVSVLHGDDTTKLRNIKFQFQQSIDWIEWRNICIPRLKHAAKLTIPHLPELMPHKGRMAIVGAGPTVADYVDEIKKYKISDLDNVMSLNATHNWLIQHGVIPRIHVISEFDVEDVSVALGGPPHKEVTYYISSACHENISRQLTNHKRVLWHQFMPMQGYQQAISRYFKNEFMVASGFATFFKSLAIATVLGFRDFELFGLDSSFEESSHVGGYAIANRETKLSVWAGDPWGHNLKKFTSQGNLVFQAKEFIEFCKYNQSGLKLRVCGDGLLRHLHETRHPEQYIEQKE
jgi:Protein of unknown function DUF115